MPVIEPTGEEVAISGRYRRRAGEFARKVAKVASDRWDAGTPCTDWTVRDLVTHVTEMNTVHIRRLDHPPPPGLDASGEPLAAFCRVRDCVQSYLDDPVRARARLTGPDGPSTFARTIDHFIGFELLVHGWDLARATGQDERIDPAELARLWEVVRMVGDDEIHGGGVFSAATAPPSPADDQARLLAYLGREP